MIDQSDVFNPHLFANFPRARHLRLDQKNSGLVCNMGAQEAESEILIFLLDDFDTNFIGTAYFEETGFSIRVRKARY